MAKLSEVKMDSLLKSSMVDHFKEEARMGDFDSVIFLSMRKQINGHSYGSSQSQMESVGDDVN
jgi:hypothetical protein